MHAMLPTTSALGLLLALAVQSPASPIESIHPSEGAHVQWGDLDGYGLRSLGWRVQHGPKQHRAETPAILSHKAHGFVPPLFAGAGFQAFRPDPVLCGGAPGYGLGHDDKDEQYDQGTP